MSSFFWLSGVSYILMCQISEHLKNESEISVFFHIVEAEDAVSLFFCEFKASFYRELLDFSRLKNVNNAL